MSDSGVAKKRGRPSKNTVAAIETNNSAKDIKKKKTTDKKEIKSEDDVVSAKRGRGRPKGSTKPSKPVKSTNKQRGRGRPKKAEPAASESSAEENDNDTDE